MVSLTRLISAAVGAALLNKEIRQAFMSSQTKSAKVSNRPEPLQALIEGALAFIMLWSMKGSWIAQPAAISAIAALLVSLMKSKKEQKEQNETFGQKDQVIDIEDYTIVDEK
jgi:hypothetical protein